MEIQHVADEDRSKAIAILAVFAVLVVAAIWFSRRQGWVLVVEISAVLIVLIAFAIVYDHFVIR